MTTTFVRPPTFSEHDPKSSEVHRLLATIGDHRLDAPEGVSLAIDVFDMLAGEQSPLDSREVLRHLVSDRFSRLRNAGVAVRALDLLRNPLGEVRRG